jgi:hypothetical protein
MQFSTLTIDLAERGAIGGYQTRYMLLRPDAEASEVIGSPEEVVLPTPRPMLDSPEAITRYTKDLSDRVFGNDSGKYALNTAKAIAEAVGAILRIRVSAETNVQDVMEQQWELLADPRADYRPLAWGERTCLSRFMPAVPSRTPPRPPVGRLRAIGLVANPTNLSRLAPIVVEDEMAHIEESIATARIRRLYGSRANLEPLLEELRDGCDVLYLVCHGRMMEGKSYLYFEDAQHKARIVDGSELASRIQEAKTPPPRLVVLASCDSAGTATAIGTDEGTFFASIAALLIRAGSAAVIGMQGRILQEESRIFVKAFFKELLAHGHVEAAAAAARMQLPQAAAWWLPTLLLAVESGVLWAGGPPREFSNWDEVLRAVSRGKATPILGSEVVERLSKRRAVAFFSDKLRHRTPGKPSLELQNVAQQLKVENNKERPATVLESFYLDAAAEEGIDRPELTLSQAVSEWGRSALSPPAFNAYRDIASWPVPLFITTNPDELLKDALDAQKKVSARIVCPWKDETPGAIEEIPRNLRLDPRTPVIFHLFGDLQHLGQRDDPSPTVLTEDDFFDHLIWISQHSSRTIPPEIPQHLAMSSLLFLGFRLDDWEFRVVLRNIAKMQSVEMLAKQLHVAVQLDPTELTADQQADAQRALEDYFRNTDLKLSVYWGTVEDFLREMRRERQRRERPQPPHAAESSANGHSGPQAIPTSQPASSVSDE